MRILLKPDVARSMGVVLLKPGSELLSMFRHGRVLIEPEPGSMAHLPSGRVPDARQPLSQDKSLEAFFTDERVIAAAGGLPGLEFWLEHNVHACQYQHSEYHHKELVTMRHPPGSMLLCWHCENQLREQTTRQLSELARRNVIDWVIDTVRIRLRYSKERELALAELCWWAVCAGIGDAITEEMAARSLLLPVEPFLSVYKESDIVPSVPATSILQREMALVKPIDMPPAEEPPKVLTLAADPESPESFMLRPKRRRWVCKPYTDWVKTQPCSGCQRPADDPHHIIGHGMGGTATKAHDLFVIPLCRECHDELHADVSVFEQKHGTQLELLFRFLDKALGIGVIVKA
ncbi:DUF968 domain-containing protein [Trabulsiella odontotermitis]|uniref:DUF968 domain-containing protein n=1 Tax=Trabulsiella odontotermitis TaxID=379893 RepID=UPI0024B72714|nr:DUF968 domain-containing protein [Trabulsiella odontotermitis]WHP32821.1 DUF968 domain-containing protein [Trabulsiella odontotermitis]